MELIAPERNGFIAEIYSLTRREAALETIVRPSNGFLSALSTDDYELLRPHLRTVDLPHDAVLVEAG
ncbi:Crp/Fnr family transcriptional regulator, partial [Pseudomonas sp. GW460-C3]